MRLFSGDVKLWKSYRGHKAAAGAVAFPPDGKLIATAAADRTEKR